MFSLVTANMATQDRPVPWTMRISTLVVLNANKYTSYGSLTE
jgi:hypothetical protein